MLRAKYLNQFEALEGKLDALASLLADYEDDQLAVSPAEGVWSPTQLIFHLRRSEQMSFLYLKKKLSFDPDLPKVGLKAKTMCLVLGIVMNSPIKMPAPKGVGSDVMPTDISAAKQLSKWKDLRVEMRSYLQEMPDKWLDRLVYKHPYAGRLTVGQMLTFFDMHFNRHLKQLKQRLPAMT